MLDLLHTSYDNIPGVICIDTSIPGPAICISACTHGGEVAGLDVIKFLLEDFHIEAKLQQGKIYFMLANIAAYKKYLETNDFATSRYIDENMNRCATEENIEHGQSSEAQRLRQIEPLLAQMNYHVDIHTTSKSATSMAIYSGKHADLFQEILNVDEHYIGFSQVQIGKSLIDICERHGGTSLGLEMGRQDDIQAYLNGIDNVCRILAKLDMIDASLVEQYRLAVKGNRQIKMVDSVVVKNKDTFKLSKDFSHMELLKKGDIIAFQDGEPLIAEDDYIVVLPTSPSNICSGEEYCFLGKELA